MIVQSQIYSSNIGKFYTYPYLFTEVYTFLTNRKLLFIHSRHTNKYVKSQLIQLRRKSIQISTTMIKLVNPATKYIIKIYILESKYNRTDYENKPIHIYIENFTAIKWKLTD